mgnify:CR=1 FL=1
MWNGFPIGGRLVHPDLKTKCGMLGTTFGGNHLACSASLAVLEIIKKEKLQHHAKSMETYFRAKAEKIKGIKIKGRGLMLGLAVDFEVGPLRKSLIYEQNIFTGGSSNKHILRILQPVTVHNKHMARYF